MFDHELTVRSSAMLLRSPSYSSPSAVVVVFVFNVRTGCLKGAKVHESILLLGSEFPGVELYERRKRKSKVK